MVKTIIFQNHFIQPNLIQKKKQKQTEITFGTIIKRKIGQQKSIQTNPQENGIRIRKRKCETQKT